MQYWPHVLAMIVGAGLTLQIGMNATVSRALGSPILASVANFCVGLAGLVLVALASGARPPPGAIGQVPTWAWFGGLLGAAYVASVTVLGPRLGAVALLALVLFGQMATALAVDYFGVVGFPQSAITPSRMIGAVLLLVGVVLIVRR